MRIIFKWLKYVVVAFIVSVIAVFVVAYSNRDALLEHLNTELSKGINGKLQITKLDFTVLHRFPNFSLTLHDVYLRDSVYQQDIFSAQKIFLDIGLYELFRNEIRINSLTLHNANVFLFRPKNGRVNSDMFKKEKESPELEKEPSYLLSLPEFEFRNVQITYVDSSRNKWIKFQFLKTKQTLQNKDSLYLMDLKGSLHFNGLIFNNAAGGFLMDKNVQADLHLAFDQSLKNVTLYPSFLQFKTSKVFISGEFETPSDGSYALNFRSSKLDLEEGKSLISKKLSNKLNKFTLDKPIDVEVALKGKSAPGSEPSVAIQFHAEDTRFSYEKMDFTELTFIGAFTFSPDTLSPARGDNSKIAITSFRGKIEKVPFNGNVTFTELQDPLMDLSMSSKIDFKQLNTLVDTTQVVTRSGSFSTEVNYTGKLEEYLDQSRTKYEGTLKGTIKTMNASLHYKPKRLLFDKINAAFTFTEKQFNINALSLRLNGSEIELKGLMKNFIPFFIKPKDKGYIKLEVFSPHLDLTSLSSKRSEQKKTAKQISQGKKKMTDLLDLMSQKLEFDIRTKASEFIFRKFTAQNVSGRIKLSHDKLEGEAITMKVADGIMNCDFILSEINKPVSPMRVTTKVTDANIKEFFLCFNNFNQRTIGAENLSGSISAYAKFQAHVDDDYKVLAPSMKGNIECKIKDGGLKNFEPLQNISNFLFKKRDFSDVQFAELNSRFTVEGLSLDISRMEIQSNVLSMFVHGRYSFTDSTSLSVQLPLSNLKKRDKNYKPENIGVDAKAGPSVFLHVYRNKDINSKINIAYDPFKKWAKK